MRNRERHKQKILSYPQEEEKIEIERKTDKKRENEIERKVGGKIERKTDKENER